MTPEEFALAVLQILAPQLANELMNRLFPDTPNLKPAQEHYPFIMSDTVTNTNQAVRSNAYGLQALHDDIASSHTSIYDAVQTAQTLILAAIATKSSASIAPDWYTAPPAAADLTGIPNAVWSWPLFTYSPSVWDGQYGRADGVLQDMVTRINAAIPFNGYPIPGNPYFRVVTPNEAYYFDSVGQWSEGNPYETLPAPLDIAAILPTDTVLSYLTREQPTFGWTTSAGSLLINAGTVISAYPESAPWVQFIPTFTDLDLAQISRTSGTVTLTVPVAPIWPGIANVTLGDAVSLSDGVTVDGPMHGLLITITSHPSWAGKYAFGDVNSWVHCGSVIFGNDDVEYEYPQQIGLDSHLLTPKQMVQAASAIVRLNSGFGGTATPWTKTA